MSSWLCPLDFPIPSAVDLSGHIPELFGTTLVCLSQTNPLSNSISVHCRTTFDPTSAMLYASSAETAQIHSANHQTNRPQSQRRSELRTPLPSLEANLYIPNWSCSFPLHHASNEQIFRTQWNAALCCVPMSSQSGNYHWKIGQYDFPL